MNEVFDAGVKPLQEIMGIVADDGLSDGEKLDKVMATATQGIVDIYAARKAATEATGGHDG